MPQPRPRRFYALPLYPAPAWPISRAARQLQWLWGHWRAVAARPAAPDNPLLGRLGLLPAHGPVQQPVPLPVFVLYAWAEGYALWRLAVGPGQIRADARVAAGASPAEVRQRVALGLALVPSCELDAAEVVETWL